MRVQISGAGECFLSTSTAGATGTAYYCTKVILRMCVGYSISLQFYDDGRLLKNCDNNSTVSNHTRITGFPINGNAKWRKEGN